MNNNLILIGRITKDIELRYTPSYELKTDEFAILLDGLIQEAEQQGIDTRSPEEIERDSKLYEKSND